MIPDWYQKPAQTDADIDLEIGTYVCKVHSEQYGRVFEAYRDDNGEMVYGIELNKSGDIIQNLRREDLEVVPERWRGWF